MKRWVLPAICGLIFFAVALTGQQAPPPDGMALIPAGEFWQGRTYRTLQEELGMMARARIDDLPAHRVYLDAFYIDKTEVTNAEYFRFAEATNHRKPYHWVGGQIPKNQEKFPIYNVSWDDANGYCTWAGKRLPTESEWEKAARGGDNQTRFPWGDELAGRAGGARGQAPPATTEVADPDNPLANQAPAGRGRGGAAAKLAHYGWPEGPVAVASFAPNGYGVYDVVGNVAEWVADWYSHGYYSVSPEKNPKGPATGLYRVLRSNGWNESDERILAITYRNFSDPVTRALTIGFRCAK